MLLLCILLNDSKPHLLTGSPGILTTLVRTHALSSLNRQFLSRSGIISSRADVDAISGPRDPPKSLQTLALTQACVSD